MKCRALEILHSERKTESGKKNEQSLKRAVERKQNSNKSPHAISIL